MNLNGNFKRNIPINIRNVPVHGASEKKKNQSQEQTRMSIFYVVLEALTSAIR